MSYIVISSYENVDTGDLQAQGEAIAVFASEAQARAHFAQRAGTLDSAVRVAREHDAQATFISWIAVLEMPLEVTNVEEALEDLETVIEETESADDPFGELVIAYQGRRYEPSNESEYPQKEALLGLEGWLS
ncbi:MAG TPA: hypothetical protein VGC55_10075 [Dokdonella sp.]